MKKIIFYLTLLFSGFTIISCGRTNDAIIGKWEDHINLSQKNATVNSNANSIVITTQSTDWWLNEISLNGSNVDLSSIDKHSKNFTLTTSAFQLERKEDGKRILISMNPNTTNSERTLTVSMQAGDYFDGIKIIQTK